MDIGFSGAVVVAASVLGAGMALPQAWRIIRTGTVHGVSPTWAAMSAAVNAWWVVYGLGVDEISIVPVSIISAIAYLAIACALVRFGASRLVLRRLALGSLVALVPLPVLLLDGWTSAGLVLGAIYAVQLSPAVRAVYRSSDISGVSAATWGLAWLEAMLWGVYAMPRRDLGLLALAATGLLMSSLVLVRLFVRRPRRVPHTTASGAFASA